MLGALREVLRGSSLDAGRTTYSCEYMAPPTGSLWWVWLVLAFAMHITSQCEREHERLEPSPLARSSVFSLTMQSMARERANFAIRIVIFLTSVPTRELFKIFMSKSKLKASANFWWTAFLHQLEAYICWPTELIHSNYTDISDHRFDFDSIFNYRE